MPDFEVSEFIKCVAKLIARLSPEEILRIRLAVSPSELEQIREHFLFTKKVCHYRIMNIPLVIEDNPTNPLLVSEFK